jgi:hypothetical protein
MLAEKNVDKTSKPRERPQLDLARFTLGLQRFHSRDHYLNSSRKKHFLTATNCARQPAGE